MSLSENRKCKPSLKATEAAAAAPLYEALLQPLRTIAGKRHAPGQNVSCPLDAFRFVPHKQSRFKGPSLPASRTQKARAANRVLSQDQVQPEQACLPPLVPADTTIEYTPRVLILGSAPSVDSLAKLQYYAHKMNHFWPVVADVFQLAPETHAEFPFSSMEYKDRVKLLQEAGVIVWDVCALFVRPGSLDSALKCTLVNPVEELLVKYPSIEVVGLNGQTAHKLFEKRIAKAGKLPRAVRYVCLPSTSPLHAMKNAVEEKAKLWKAALL